MKGSSREAEGWRDKQKSSLTVHSSDNYKILFCHWLDAKTGIALKMCTGILLGSFSTIFSGALAGSVVESRANETQLALPYIMAA